MTHKKDHYAFNFANLQHDTVEKALEKRNDLDKKLVKLIKDSFSGKKEEKDNSFVKEIIDLLKLIVILR